MDKKIAKGKKLLINTIIIGIGKFSSQVIVFLMLPIYTSNLSTNEYGFYDTLISVATFLVPIITMLLEESMFRYLIEYRGTKKTETVISNTLIYCFSSLIIFSVLYSIFCTFFDFEYKWYFLIYIIFYTLYAVSNAVTRGLGKVKEYAISNFIANVLMVTFNLFAILKVKAGVPGLFISYSLGIFFAISFVMFKVDIKKYFSFSKFDKNLFKEMFKYSIPLVPNTLSWSIINVSDRIMLTSLWDSSVNGIYSVANKFPQAMGSVYNFFSIAWKESASMELGDRKYYSEVINKILKLLLIASICILSVLPLIYVFFVDEAFIESYYYVPILLVAMIFSNISEYFSGILIAYKRTKIIGITTIIAAAINIIINIFFIRKYGILAASVSTLLATLTVAILRIIIIKKYICIDIRYKKYIPYFLLIIFSVINYYLKNDIVNLAYIIIVSICIAILNRNIINQIISKIKKRYIDER